MNLNHNHQHNQHHPMRARHTIRLSSIRHNYNVVSSAANKQRCSVITVVKADGYGHGAIETATHLADYCGADAFAVATLEEGIALRKALMETSNSSSSAAAAAASGGCAAVAANIGLNSSLNLNGTKSMINKTKNKKASITSSTLFTPPPPPKSIDVQSLSSDVSSMLPVSMPMPIPGPVPILSTTAATTKLLPRKKIRSNNIRIIVLGPPTNIPNDFHLYNHHNIELMVSSSTMARALMEWVADCDGRRIAEVDQVASERLQELVSGEYRLGELSGEEVERKGALGMRNAMMMNHNHDSINDDNNNNIQKIGGDENKGGGGNEIKDVVDGHGQGHGRGGLNVGALLQNTKGVIGHQATTLTSMEGSALGKEVRELLNKKKDAVATAATTAATVNATGVTINTAAATTATGANGEMNNNNENHSVDPSRATLAKSDGNNCGLIYTIPTIKQNTTMMNTNINRNRRASPTHGSSMQTASASAQPFPFKGIEDTAKESRRVQLAAKKLTAHFTGEGEDSSDDENENDSKNKYNNNNNSESSSVSVCTSRASTTSSSSFAYGNSNGNFVSIVNDNELDDGVLVKTVSSAVASAAIAAATNNAVPIKARKRVRWHMLVDSGMGRLGFKGWVEDGDNNDNVDDNYSGEGEEEKKGGDCAASPYGGRESGTCGRIGSGNSSLFGDANLGSNGEKRKDKWKEGPHRDTVSIIKDMTHAEIDGAPIEFYGMCTHMAEASSNSSYTNEQMNRFKSLLRRVRQAGICVPTISTDNSSALLTPTLTHFDPIELLSQPAADTRGFVRTGGAVYGQRPAFTQLRAVSTLTASVRHVAVLEKGESVGYDRAYMAERNVRIATLSIGFADGYPRELGNGKGKVCIRGKTFPVAGNVCMDMLMVDLGSADNICDVGAQVSIGDTAYLWGPEVDDDGEGEVRLQDVAKSLNTTQSALTCGLDKIRVQRQYID